MAFTLDYPLPQEAYHRPGCCPSIVLRRLRESAWAAGLAYQLRSRNSMKLLVVLHYDSIEPLCFLLEALKQELRERADIGLEDVDGYAVGGLVSAVSSWSLLLVEKNHASP